MKQTMVIEDLIKRLQEIAKEFPKMNVYLASDSEGNDYGTLDKEWSFGAEDERNALLLFPYEDHLIIDEL